MKLFGLESQKKALNSAIKLQIPSLLIGETATGKTSVAKEVCEELGRELVRVNVDGGCTPDELIGRYQVRAGKSGNPETYFQKGILPLAMEKGQVVLLDEVNASLPDTLFCLHSVLEENPRLLIPETNEEIKPAPGFAVIATMNPSHDYAGTKGLNPAFYSRFGVVLRFENLKGAKLVKALKDHVTEARPDDVVRIAKILEEVSRKRKDEKISTRITMREAIAALTLSCDGLDIEESIDCAITLKLEEFEREELSDVIKASVSIPSGFTLEQLFNSMSEMDDLKKRNQELEAEILGLQEMKELFSKISSLSVKK